MIEQHVAASEPPVLEPVFTQVVQIGIVVRDLEATIQTYVEEYGIGPWQRHAALTSANATPLLPGQDPAKIPSPERVETLTVVTSA